MKCQKCGYTGEGLTTLQTRKYKGKVYKYFICRPCNALKQRNYRQTEKGKKWLSKTNRRFYILHPDRVKARTLAQSIPSSLCEVCGEKKTHRHHDDYSRPLDVRFLCPLHHKMVHPKQKVIL